MVFTGSYQRAIDDKGRVMLPKKLREEIGQVVALFLTPGTDRCLELHTPQSIQELAHRASQSAAGSKQVKSFSRLFYAQAEQSEIDSLGRIRLSRNLVEYATLEREIVILGVGANWEIWNAESWQVYLQTNEQAFDQISQATFDSIPGTLTPGTDFNKTEDVETHSANLAEVRKADANSPSGLFPSPENRKRVLPR